MELRSRRKRKRKKKTNQLQIQVMKTQRKISMVGKTVTAKLSSKVKAQKFSQLETSTIGCLI